MGNCPICKAGIEAWQTLCKECWQRAEDSYKAKKQEDGELIEKLRGQAKSDLMYIIREICRKCSKVNKDVDNLACTICAFKEKEKLIRAFVE